jgi:hypothetical protein
MTYANLLASPPTGLASFVTNLEATNWHDDQAQQIASVLANNPNVAVLTVSATGTVSATIPFLGNPSTIPHPIDVGYDCWVFIGRATPVTIIHGIGVGSSKTLYSGSGSAIFGSWFKSRYYGLNAYQNITSGPSDTYNNFQLSVAGLSAGACVIVMNLMVFPNEVTAYNAFSYPNLPTVMSWGQRATALCEQSTRQAMRLLRATSLTAALS